MRGPAKDLPRVSTAPAPCGSGDPLGVALYPIQAVNFLSLKASTTISTPKITA